MMERMPMQMPERAEGMLDTVKSKLDLDTMMSGFSMQQMGFYAGVGVAGLFAGFLLKRYSQYLIFAALLVGGIFGLQYFGYISPFQINWMMIQQQLGMQPWAGNGLMLNNMMNWARANFLFVLSGLLGFLFGLKIG